jgi:hypothetical protein
MDGYLNTKEKGNWITMMIVKHVNKHTIVITQLKIVIFFTYTYFNNVKHNGK